MNYTNRILVVDDDPSIHDAFTKILLKNNASQGTLDAARSAFTGAVDKQAKPDPEQRALIHAHQGEEAVKIVTEAMEAGDPIAVAFVDVRMPPGIDGVETVRRIWQVAPETEIVLCTAWSDYSHEDTLQSLGNSHHLLILKKPFESIEVRQMALALHEKRRSAQQTEVLMQDLQAASSETKAYASSLVTANRALSLSKKATDYATRLKSEALKELTGEMRFLAESVLGRFLKTGDTQGVEQAIDQTQSLLTRLEATMDPGQNAALSGDLDQPKAPGQ